MVKAYHVHMRDNNGDIAIARIINGDELAPLITQWAQKVVVPGYSIDFELLGDRKPIDLYENLLKLVGEEVFEAKFFKKNGELRTMRCVITDWVQQLDSGLMCVWDQDYDGFRSVNLNTVLSVTFNDTTYTPGESEWLPE